MPQNHLEPLSNVPRFTAPPRHNTTHPHPHLETMRAVLAVLLLTFATVEAKKGFGFGDQFAWHALDDGIAEVKKTGKPGFVLHHREWCGACKALSKSFAASAAIEDKAQDFVMINCNDENDGCEDAAYKVNGKGYFPRVFFLNPQGEVQPEIIAPNGNEQYPHYYSSEQQILGAMDTVLTNNDL